MDVSKTNFGEAVYTYISYRLSEFRELLLPFICFITYALW